MTEIGATSDAGSKKKQGQGSCSTIQKEDKSVQEREAPMLESTPNWYKTSLKSQGPNAKDEAQQPSGRNRPDVPPWRQHQEAASSSRGYSPDRSRSARDNRHVADEDDSWWTDRHRSDPVPPWRQERSNSPARRQKPHLLHLARLRPSRTGAMDDDED